MCTEAVSSLYIHMNVFCDPVRHAQSDGVAAGGPPVQRLTQEKHVLMVSQLVYC